MHLSFRATRPLVAANLVHGDRRKGAKVKGPELTKPIGDAAWPDDTIVALSFEKQESGTR